MSKIYRASFEDVKNALRGQNAAVGSFLGLPPGFDDKRQHDCPLCGKKKLRISDPETLRGGCDGCGVAWNDKIGLAARYRGQRQGEARQDLAEKFCIYGDGHTNQIAYSTPATIPTPVAPHSSPTEAGLDPDDGLSEHKQYLELTEWNDSLADFFCLKNPGITVESLKAIGARFGKWRQFASSKPQTVICIPIYAGPDLRIVNWVIFSATGGTIETRVKESDQWVTESVRKRAAFSGSDRVGIITTLAARDAILSGSPLSDAIGVKSEGESDLLAMISIMPDAFSLDVIAWTNSDGARSTNTSKWFFPMLAKLELTCHGFIGDRDKAGELGSKKWTEEHRRFGPAKNVILDLPYSETKGKDLRDFIQSCDGDAATKWEMLQSVIAATPTQSVVVESAADDRFPIVSDGREHPGSDVSQSNSKYGFKNYVIDNVDGEDVTNPIPLKEIVAELFATLDGWPKRCGNRLFAIDRGKTRSINSVSSLFALIRERIPMVDWSRAGSMASREELWESVLVRAESFEILEQNPHFPPRPEIYYCHPPVEAGNGIYLEQFLDYFTPASDIDRQLLKALIVTTFWGGPPGCRPGFSISSLGGQGKGKTKVTQFISSLTGGVIDFDQNSKPEDVTKRLLNGAVNSRVPRFDNVKAQWFSSQYIESLITQDSISGSILYQGNGSRPNYFTFVFTFNNPEFSRDLAQRLVPVVLGDPDYDPEWESRVIDFLGRHRWDIVQDVKAFFESPKKEISSPNRWSSWQGEVLGRLDDPDEIIKTISLREREQDHDSQLAGEILKDLFSLLIKLGYEKPYSVHVRNSRISQLISEITGENYSIRQSTALIDRLISCRLLAGLKRNPSNSSGEGRGYIARLFDDDTAAVRYDLEQRIRDTERGSRY